jgi:hypothetical protein
MTISITVVATAIMQGRQGKDTTGRPEEVGGLGHNPGAALPAYQVVEDVPIPTIGD